MPRRKGNRACPVCFGFGWIVEEVRKEKGVRYIRLSDRKCLKCNGSGNRNRIQRLGVLVKWVPNRETE